MKSLNYIQTLAKIGKILSKITFICLVIGFCGCIVGMIGLGIGNESLFKIGGVTLHDRIIEEYSCSIHSAIASLAGALVIFTGNAVLAKFAETYFDHEMTVGTPFTHAGAKELLRLGILTLAIPTGCAVIGRIIEGIVAGFMDVETIAAMDRVFDNESSIVLGIMFIVVSLLCQYGADVTEDNKN